MAANATTLSPLVKPQVLPAVEVLKYINTELTTFFELAGMPMHVSQGGDSFDWKISAGPVNTATEIFTEGQAPAAAGNQTYASPELAYIYFRTVAQLSGHAGDQMRSSWVSGDEASAAQLFGELSQGWDDVQDLVNTTFMGSANNGLQQAIDSTGTFAGINRATTTQFASLETAVGGALTAAVMRDAYEGLRDNDRGGKPEAILMPWNQVSNYESLAGASNGTDAAKLLRIMGQPGQGTAFDLGWATNGGSVLTGMSYSGIPIYGLGDQTNEVILWLSGVQSKWRYAVQRDMHQRPLSISDDTEAKVQLSFAATPACLAPHQQAKLTGVTA
jgi:hypothetical protein